jgi:hypothetical protein
MKAMLEQLKQADHATYEAFTGLHERHPEICIESKVSMAWLQEVLQEAIQARDRWEYVMELVEDRRTAVFIGKPSGTDIQYGPIHFADCPAHALLAAYLAAIDFKD